jgi:hypothetical protein
MLPLYAFMARKWTTLPLLLLLVRRATQHPVVELE